MKQQQSSRTSGGGADLAEASTSTPEAPSNQLLLEQMQQELANQPAEEDSLLDEADAAPTGGGGGGSNGLRMGIPLADVIYEQLAHRAAYLQFPASLQLDRPDDPRAFEADRRDADGGVIQKWKDVAEIRKLIDKLGYTPSVVHDDPLTGFQAILFEPTVNGVLIQDQDTFMSYGLGHGLRPVVAFRGSQDHRSWADDFDPEGIGTHQFAMNEVEIVKLLTLGADDQGPADVTGHSLGGALAQLAASRYPSLVKRCVTFQAPGISRDEAVQAQDDDVASTHYRMAGDIVPISGEAHTYGTGSKARCFDHEDVADWNPGSRYTQAHVMYPLEDIHASADQNDQPFIPALQEFHDARDEDGRDPKVTEVFAPPKVLGIGSGESFRLDKVGARRLNVAEDWLNGPTVALSERLRANLAAAYRAASDRGEDGLDCEAQVAAMTRFVGQAEGQVVAEALAAWVACCGDTDDALPPGLAAPDEPLMRRQLQGAWLPRRQRLIEQTATLVRMQLGQDAWMKAHGVGELHRRAPK